MTEFKLLSVWSKFHRKMIVSHYTDSHTCSNESSDTEHSVLGMETGWKLSILFSVWRLVGN